MATAGPELAQAAGAAFKVMVIQCGWALTGSKTESRGASGGHGERYAGIGVVPGLGWLGPQVSSVGSGDPGAAFLWTVAVPPLAPLELRAGMTTVKAACLQPSGPLMSWR